MALEAVLAELDVDPRSPKIPRKCATDFPSHCAVDLKQGDRAVPKVTIVLGIALILLGVGGYVGTGMEHPTALIPAGFGLIFVIAGVLALNEKRLKHAMHAAAAAGLLGFLGSASGLGKVVSSFGSGELERPAAAYLQSVMAVLCGVFVVLCVRSFIDARRKNALT